MTIKDYHLEDERFVGLLEENQKLKDELELSHKTIRIMTGKCIEFKEKYKNEKLLSEKRRDDGIKMMLELQKYKPIIDKLINWQPKTKTSKSIKMLLTEELEE